MREVNTPVRAALLLWRLYRGRINDIKDLFMLVGYYLYLLATFYLASPYKYCRLTIRLLRILLRFIWLGCKYIKLYLLHIRLFYLVIKYKILKFFLSLLLAMVVAVNAPLTKADALGITGSIEILKLSEIIIQMTQLLDKTEQFIQLQEEIKTLQHRSFFRSAANYAQQMELLASLSGNSINGLEYAQQLTALDIAVSELRRVGERAQSFEARRGLYGFADSLEILIDATTALETTSKLLTDIASSDKYNSQDQLLAGINWTLTKMEADNSQEQFTRDIERLNNEHIMFGAFNVFTLQE